MKTIIKYELVINKALRSALNYDTPDEQINDFIRFFGKHIGSDRIYIFEDCDEKHVTNNTYEWLSLIHIQMCIRDSCNSLPWKTEFATFTGTMAAAFREMFDEKEYRLIDENKGDVYKRQIFYKQNIVTLNN